MPAGNAQRRPAHLHVRSFDQSRVDLIAQIYIGISRGAHIAHRRESRLQRGLRIARANQRALRHARRKLMVRIEVVVVRQMRMHIDQPRQYCQRAQIDLRVPRLLRRRCRRRNRRNAIASDSDGLIGELVSSVNIDYATRSN